jgi:gluconokinase
MSMAGSPSVSDPPRLVVVMGVAGCGKSTVAEALAARIGATYTDGDSLHPPGNIARMSAGIPLTDTDRWPWLDAVAAAMRDGRGRQVMACSALRRVYRLRLTEGAGEPVYFAFLDGSRELIAARMHQRSGHFMPESLLDSQFAALERPGPEEFARAIDIDAPVGMIVERICEGFEWGKT